MRPLHRPSGVYHFFRDQLGSVRAVYLGADETSRKRRDDFGKRDEIVLMIHGFFQTRNIWEILENRLRHEGYAVMSFNLGGLLWRFNTHPIDKSASMIAQKVERLAERHGFERIHVIGHSKGGLIARRWVQHYGGHHRVKSLLTLGTPHHGTPTALIAVALMGFGAWPSSARDLLPRSGVVARLGRDVFPATIPLTSVYSREDLVCPHWCSVLRPRPGEGHQMRNVELRGLGHSQLVWDPQAYGHILEHLEQAAQLWMERA